MVKKEIELGLVCDLDDDEAMEVVRPSVWLTHGKLLGTLEKIFPKCRVVKFTVRGVDGE